MTTKTYKNIPNYLMATMLILFSIGMTESFADHPLYSGWRWQGTTTAVYYDQASLNLLNIDGSTNNFSLASFVLDNARNDWNDEPSIFSFTKTTTAGHNVISAALGTSGPTGETTIITSSGVITDADTSINRDYTWSSAVCTTSQPFFLKRTTTHEFGHWLSFNDINSPFTPSSTIMWNAYTCQSTTVKAHDSTALTTVYG